MITGLMWKVIKGIQEKYVFSFQTNAAQLVNKIVAKLWSECHTIQMKLHGLHQEYLKTVFQRRILAILGCEDCFGAVPFLAQL